MQTSPDRPVVTGATGFVGRVLMSRLPAGALALPMRRGDWARSLDESSLAGATLFHLAARVHAVEAASEDDYMRDNAEKTRALAERAARAGAQAFVFLSTIKVNGEETRGRPFTADDPPAPRDAYARSKLAAERHLAEIAGRTGLAVTVVRAPLVYGAGAGGNLMALLRLADTPWPLPFGALRNRRSFVHVRDLCDLLLRCAGRADAHGRTYLAAHAHPVSTAEWVARMRQGLGRPARLFPMPAALLEMLAAPIAGGERIRRLTRSLEVDPGAAHRGLGWAARIDAEEAAREMAAAWREAKHA